MPTRIISSKIGRKIQTLIAIVYTQVVKDWSQMIFNHTTYYRYVQYE